MDKELVSSLLRNNHYFRTGIFFIGALISLCALIEKLGEFRFVFLFALLFVPLLVVEFIVYHLTISEIRHKKTCKGIMKLGRMEIIELRKTNAGIQFEGIINGKVKILKYYTLEDIHERTMNNLARYKKVEFEYYNRSSIVIDFHPVSGE